MTSQKLCINLKKLLLSTIFLIVLFCSTTYASEKLEVHFIDVGQGDATLIRIGKNSMLIDGGGAKESSLIFSYLDNLDIDELDYIVCTHADEDHVGGLPGAVTKVGKNIGVVLAPYKNKEKVRYETFVTKLEEYGHKITVPKVGTQYSLGSARFQIISIGKEDNDDSIVIRLDYGNNSFIFTGDISSDVEDVIMDSGYDVQCDVLKVAHHGSKTSTGYRWLRQTEPKYAVISVGEGNEYGHPAEEVLSRLQDCGAKIYRTDKDGTIVFSSDGKKITIESNKSIVKKEDFAILDSSNNKKDTEARHKSAFDNEGDIETYILNTNTKKFHYPYCKSVNSMKEKNKKAVTDSRDNIISQGYIPCKNCNP